MIEVKKKIAPEYPKIPHLKGKSNLSEDDIEIEIDLGITAYIQEKVDGANCGISWLDGPILRNRSHVLNKGFMKNTSSKKQFVPAWNWIHEKEDDIKEVIKRWQGQVTIYGEWLLAKHSLDYSNLPDYFLAYDVWSCEELKFVSPGKFEELFKGLNIKYIESEKTKIETFSDIQTNMDKPSKYRNGMKEGVVIKTTDDSDYWIEKVFKIVSKDFKRNNDWNNKVFEKNKLVKRETV